MARRNYSGYKLPYNENHLKGKKTTATGTFAEDEINMPRSEYEGVLPALIGITVLHPKMSNLADKYSEWALCTKSNDAFPDMDDSEVICLRKRVSGTNAAPVNVEDQVEHISFDAPIPIMQEKLYFQLQQDTGAGHDYYYILHWVPRQVPGAQQVNNMRYSVQY